jgi:hypothetical protein
MDFKIENNKCSGYVLIKRKNFWSKRFCIIENGILKYKKNENDKNFSLELDLNKSKI